MEQTDGMRKEIKIIPFGPGEAHLQNEVISPDCYICHKHTDDMVLLRIDGKKMGFACTDHAGIIKEFIRQYNRLPLGWNKTIGE